MALNLWFKTPSSLKVGTEPMAKRKKKVMKPSDIAELEQVRIANALENAVKQSQIVPAFLRAFGLKEVDLLEMAQDDDADWARDDFVGQALEDYIAHDDYPTLQKLGLVYLLRHEKFEETIKGGLF
jgi:hypothetical protein